jgi:zinc finger SWIM domain-containing protein 3
MSKYQGILLSATSVDARGSLFPIAYAIVDAENDVNWP